MKNIKKMIGVVLLSGMVCTPVLLIAQNNQPNRILVISKFHWNPNAPANAEADWRKTEKEYFDKVTMKNEYISGANTLVHYFTDDNSELLFFNVYNSWEDIEKASSRNNELIEAAWPDSVKRRAFFDKQNAFYSRKHSDEIMSILPYYKQFPTDTGRYVYYLRTEHRGYPKDGTNADFGILMNEYMTNVLNKNDYVKGYGMATHFWGADSREVLSVMVVNSLSDLENMFTKNEDLIKQHWPSEASRKAYFDKFDRYFAPWHGDAIYRNVPGLRK